MNDYGASGAALFDIVNVQSGRRADPRSQPQGRFRTGGGAAILFVNFMRWLSSSAKALAS
jgi:hypothetical protein